MMVNKMGILKMAVVCGVSALSLQPALAGWNKDIDILPHIDQKALSQLKFRCSREFVEANKNKLPEKAKKWEDRGIRIQNILRITGFLLDEAKASLLDKPAYLEKYLNKFAKSEVKVEEQAVTSAYLQEFISVLEQGENSLENQRQLSSLRAQLKKLQGENNTTTSIANNNSYSNVSVPATRIEDEIGNLEIALRGLNASTDKRDYNQVSARLAKLRNAKNAGVEVYTTEEELAAYLPAVSSATEALIAESQHPKQRFNTAKEISELENDIIPILRTYGGQPGELEKAEERLNRLKIAQAMGMSEYSEEGDLLSITKLN